MLTIAKIKKGNNSVITCDRVKVLALLMFICLNIPFAFVYNAFMIFRNTILVCRPSTYYRELHIMNL